MTADRPHSVACRIPGWTAAHVACTHDGVMLAAHTWRAIVRLDGYSRRDQGRLVGMDVRLGVRPSVDQGPTGRPCTRIVRRAAGPTGHVHGARQERTSGVRRFPARPVSRAGH